MGAYGSRSGGGPPTCALEFDWLMNIPLTYFSVLGFFIHNTTSAVFFPPHFPPCVVFYFFISFLMGVTDVHHPGNRIFQLETAFIFWWKSVWKKKDTAFNTPSERDGNSYDVSFDSNPSRVICKSIDLCFISMIFPPSCFHKKTQSEKAMIIYFPPLLTSTLHQFGSLVLFLGVGLMDFSGMFFFHGRKNFNVFISLNIRNAGDGTKYFPKSSSVDDPFDKTR